jgi:hypothetical protein
MMYVGRESEISKFPLALVHDIYYHVEIAHRRNWSEYRRNSSELALARLALRVWYLPSTYHRYTIRRAFASFFSVGMMVWYCTYL